jgi:hypothetical protein
VLLERQVSRPLHRRHERRELPLLLRSQIEASPLKREELIDLHGDPRLVRRCCAQLTAESLPRRAFLTEHRLSPCLEAPADRRESTQLIIRQAHTLAQQPYETLANPILRSGPIAGNGWRGLADSLGCAAKDDH